MQGRFTHSTPAERCNPFSAILAFMLKDSTTIDIGIGGMTCASCVARVERSLKKIPGVLEVSVNLTTESARVVGARDNSLEGRLRRAIRDTGYEPRAANATLTEEPSPWTDFAPVAIGLLLSAPDRKSVV